MKKTYILLFFGILFSTILAQDKAVLRMGIEFGNGFVDGELPGKWNIRQSLNSQYYDYHGRDPYGGGSIFESGFSYVGIKPQVSFFNERLNVYSGLRLMMLSSSIGNGKNGDAIYLRTNNTDAIEFYKVISITEKTRYLTIPLEVSYNLFRSGVFTKDVYFSGFFKIGGEAGVKAYDKRNIRFESSKMQVHEKEVLAMVDTKLNSVYVTTYTALGFQLTTANGMQYSAEAVLPSGIRSKNNFNLIVPDAFSGFQFSVQVPLKLIF